MRVLMAADHPPILCIITIYFIIMTIINIAQISIECNTFSRVIINLPSCLAFGESEAQMGGAVIERRPPVAAHRGPESRGTKELKKGKDEL